MARKRVEVPTEGLGEFEGHPVKEAGMEIPGVAGGLRAALLVDPVKIELDQKAYVVMELKCVKVRFVTLTREGTDYGKVQRIHIMEALTSTFVDEELVSEHLERQRERIEESQGITRLPFSGDGIATGEGPPSDVDLAGEKDDGEE